MLLIYYKGNTFCATYNEESGLSLIAVIAIILSIWWLTSVHFHNENQYVY